jgi:hypothetical protein
MINKQWLEKNQVIVYLLVIVLGMAAVRIRYGYRGEESQKSEVKSQNGKQLTVPTMAVTPTIDPRKDYPLIDKLPYYGKGFVVEKYTAPMTLRMILNGATLTNASRDVSVWIDSFGDAIGQHKVEVGKTETPTRVK